MKLKLVAVAVTSLLAAGVVNAAEVYNKDGNKLDLYGKVHAQHYFSDATSRSPRRETSTPAIGPLNPLATITGSINTPAS